MIDGIETPYWELIMDGGTPCPLKAGQNRKTRVQYICNAQAFHNEILRYDLFHSNDRPLWPVGTVHFGPDIKFSV